MSFRLTLAVLLVVCFAAAAQGQLDCVVPTRERGPGTAAAANTPLRTAALAIERIAKGNRPFMAGARPIRVRTTMDYSVASPRAVIVATVAYNESGWIKGKCDVIKDADRGGGAQDGMIHVTINDPRSFFGPIAGDSDFEAYPEPKLTGQVAGHPEYNGMYVLLSRAGKVPWVPVTIAEVLDHEERKLRKRIEEWQEQKSKPGLTEADIQKSYETVKKFDPRAAEEQRTTMLKALQQQRAQQAQLEAKNDALLARQSEALKAYRASFSPPQLQMQASPGGMGAAGVVRVDDPSAAKWVKVNPAWTKLDPNRVHLLSVFRGGIAADPVAGRFAWTQQFNDTLDYTALAALLK